MYRPNRYPSQNCREEETPRELCPAPRIRMIPVGSIAPNPSQPRQVFEEDSTLRLSESIREYGMLQPISVRLPRGATCYEIIAGERRYRASLLAGLTEVPCVLFDVDEKRSAELALIENVQREDLNPFEQAGAIASLIDVYSLTQEKIASILSVSQSCVANKLRLLKLTEPERRIVLENDLTERHARAVLRLPTPEKRLKALTTMASQRMNVARSEEFVDALVKGERAEFVSSRRKFVPKDIRLFFNTVDRAVEIMSRAGVGVSRKKFEHEDGTTELVILISPSATAPAPASAKYEPATAPKCFT